MTTNQAHIAFNILVLYAGADPKMRMLFVSYAETSLWHEFRFQGSLGFGGRIYFNESACYINCYSEDATSERLGAILDANNLLSLLYEEDAQSPS